MTSYPWHTDIITRECPRKNSGRPVSDKSRGFTLVELLVAVAIFTLMSVVAYSGLNSIMQTERTTHDESERLRKLQTGLWLMERDLHHAVTRGVRDELGDAKEALIGGGLSANGLVFTYSGNPNPLGRRISSLKRVSYNLEDRKLVRITSEVLDSVQNTQNYKTALLEGIEELRFRFLDQGQQWHDSWPAPSSDPNARPGMPLAVEITLLDSKWGKITRLISLPGI